MKDIVTYILGIGLLILPVVHIYGFSIDDVIDYPYDAGNEEITGQDATDVGQVIKDT
jgi:4-hydroxybenzoate polyprenyltransferase